MYSGLKELYGALRIILNCCYDHHLYVSVCDFCEQDTYVELLHSFSIPWRSHTWMMIDKHTPQRVHKKLNYVFL